MCMCLGKVHDVAYTTRCSYLKIRSVNRLRMVVELFFDCMQPHFKLQRLTVHMLCQSRIVIWTLNTLLSRRAVYTRENYISPITQTKLYNSSAFALAKHDRPPSFAHLQQ
jgi:hypothetical protein